MQPTNLPDAAADELDDEDDDDDEDDEAAVDELPDDGAELLLLPHAATTSVADTASAAVAHALSFTLPPHGLAAAKPPAWNHLG
jgi:hypothetical protein